MVSLIVSRSARVGRDHAGGRALLWRELEPLDGRVGAEFVLLHLCDVPAELREGGLYLARQRSAHRLPSARHRAAGRSRP